MTSQEMKAALGAVRVRKFSPIYFRVCTLDESPVDGLLARAEALGFRAYKNQSYEMFLHANA